MASGRVVTGLHNVGGPRFDPPPERSWYSLVLFIFLFHGTTVKDQTIGTPKIIPITVLKMKRFLLFNVVVCPKYMANSVGPHQTAPIWVCTVRSNLFAKKKKKKKKHFEFYGGAHSSFDM